MFILFILKHERLDLFSKARSRVVKFIGAESREVVTRGWEKEDWGLLFDGHSFSFAPGKNSVDDDGGSHTTT